MKIINRSFGRCLFYVFVLFIHENITTLTFPLVIYYKISLYSISTVEEAVMYTTPKLKTRL